MSDKKSAPVFHLIEVSMTRRTFAPQSDRCYLCLFRILGEDGI
jgi:hypothetical protein